MPVPFFVTVLPNARIVPLVPATMPLLIFRAAVEFETVMTPFPAPVWSPDGKQIAFESSRDGNFEIYVLSLSR